MKMSISIAGTPAGTFTCNLPNTNLESCRYIKLLCLYVCVLPFVVRADVVRRSVKLDFLLNVKLNIGC